MLSVYFDIDINTEPSSVIAKANQFAVNAGATDTKRQEFTTIVSEICYNLIKYTPSGNISIDYKAGLIHLEAKDTGSGASIGLQKAFTEGISTGQSLGLGMPSIVRMSDDFKISNCSTGIKIELTKSLK